MKVTISILLALCGYAISEPPPPFPFPLINGGLSVIRPPFIIQPLDSGGQIRVVPQGESHIFRKIPFTPIITTLRQSGGARPNPSKRPNSGYGAPSGGYPDSKPTKRPNTGYGPPSGGYSDPKPTKRPNSGYGAPSGGYAEVKPTRRPTGGYATAANQVSTELKPTRRPNRNRNSNKGVNNIEIITSDEIYDDYDEENYPTVFLEPPKSRQNRRRPSSRRPSSSRRNAPIILLQLARSPTNTNSQNPVNPNSRNPVNPNSRNPVNPNSRNPVNPNSRNPVNPNSRNPVNPNSQNPVNPVRQFSPGRLQPTFG